MPDERSEVQNGKHAEGWFHAMEEKAGQWGVAQPWT